MENGYEIRAMAASELGRALDWAAGEGWNPGLGDAEAFFATDGEGFLLGLLGGEPVASISAVNYDGEFGFIGFYIVRPGFRGRGAGLAIWQGAVARLEGINTGLDGVVEQLGNYQKSGFTLAYKNFRYEGRALAARKGPGIIPACQVDFADIEALDRRCFPARRTGFLKAWLALPGATALVADGPQGLRGYGVIRPCRVGYKIGPLFSEPSAAQPLFEALASAIPQGAPFFLDVCERNPRALALAQKHGMRPVFATARMYNLFEPRLDHESLFGVTSFELG